MEKGLFFSPVVPSCSLGFSFARTVVTWCYAPIILLVFGISHKFCDKNFLGLLCFTLVSVAFLGADSWREVEDYASCLHFLLFL